MPSLARYSTSFGAPRLSPEESHDVVALHAAVSGRTRYRIPGLYRCPPLKEHLESTLRSHREVVSSSANVLTGNLLVCYRPELTLRQLSALLQEIIADFRAGSRHSVAGTGTADKARARKGRRGKAFAGATQQARPWHLLEAEAVAQAFQSSLQRGLSAGLPKQYLKRYGPNLLPESAPRSPLRILLGQLGSLPVLLLGASALISAVTGGLADAVAIVVVIGINAAIGYLTESEAERTIHSLQRLAHPSAVVLRDGVEVSVAAKEVVPGDLLVLRPGSHVAADGRMVASALLTVDESALTGESMPVLKKTEPLENPGAPLADRVNMAYMGTLVTGGQGSAVTVGTGRFTEMGRVQALVAEAEAPKTPMERELDRMGRRLVLLYGGVCVLVFLAGVLRGFALLELLRTSISLAVAAIPEGLPTVATTILALGIKDLKQHQVLIRHLGAAETLGSVQTICLDKTGTLTLNRMTVVALYAGMRDCRVAGGTFRAGGESVTPGSSPELARLIEVCALCNETQFAAEGREGLTGSATETALMRLATGSGADVARLRERYPLVKVQHRSESRNYMLTWHESSEGNPFSCSCGGSRSFLVAVKGSPLEVLALCRRRQQGEEAVSLSEEDRLAIELANERMAGDSLRVLGAAYACCSEEEPGDFVWLGLVGMADPLRPGVKELMQAFHAAGVETLMITGDQVATAYAIGNELGLSRGGPLRILDSEHLQEMDSELLSAFTKGVHAFARVSPAQKLQIVQALQRGGAIVAMTGDGINDSPALKAADVGVALGSGGTEVAREVADVVLEEDDLEGMLRALEHGRTIRDNIRKTLRFLLATNLSEIMVMFDAIALGVGQPLSAMQLLWINLISDIFPGLALALEPPEPDVLQRPPADPQRGIIADSDFPGIAGEAGVIYAGALAAYGYGVLRYGRGTRAGTMGFSTLAAAQLLHALSCRSARSGIFSRTAMPPNRYLTWALAGTFALQGGTLVLPGLRRLLRLERLGALDALVLALSSLVPLLVNEAAKGDGQREAP